MVKAVAEESLGLNPHVKESVYVARLAGVQERVLKVKDPETNTVEEVPRWDWVLGVRTPEGDLRMTVLTSPKFSTKSKAFGFVKALEGGKAPEIGIEIDTEQLVGKYANVVIKDKQRTDATGQVQLTSEVKEMLPVDKPPEVEIPIEGLVVEEEQEEPEDIPVPPPPPKTQGKGAKKK